MQLIIIESFILSIVHSILFFRKEIGVSVLIFTIIASIFLIHNLLKNNKLKNKKTILLIIPIILLSSTYFIFDNNIFNIINIFVILILTSIMIIYGLKDEIKIKFFISKIFNLIIGPLEFLNESLKIAKDFFIIKKQNNKKIEIINKIVKSIIISIPILLIVLFLLITADDRFAKLLSGFSEYIIKLFTSIEFIYLILRIVLIFILFLYFISFMYNLLEEKSSFNIIEKISIQKEIKIDNFIMNTILTILNIVYLVFNILQLSSIFENIKIDNYSGSARQGFFQLMIVTGINIGIIVISIFNKKENSKISKKYTKIMSILIMIFTLGILTTSFNKMNLYVENYGYTKLRIIVYSILITEGLLIIPTIIYILKEKINLNRNYFIIILCMYTILNFVNIDKLIAQKNIEIYKQNGKIDIDYIIEELGIDAVPKLKQLYIDKDIITNKENNKEDVNMKLNNYLYNKKKELNSKEITWQSFNISKYIAKKELQDLNLEYKKIYTNKYKYDYYNENYDNI